MLNVCFVKNKKINLIFGRGKNSNSNLQRFCISDFGLFLQNMTLRSSNNTGISMCVMKIGMGNANIWAISTLFHPEDGCMKERLHLSVSLFHLFAFSFSLFFKTSQYISATLPQPSAGWFWLYTFIQKPHEKTILHNT